jgi:hypothetical protein
MPLEDLTLMLFGAFNSLRILAYIPQIRKAATDANGASAISYTTWSLFLIAHVSTVAYALVNREDWGLAACFAGNALCCAAILIVAFLNRRGYARRVSMHGLAVLGSDRPVRFEALRRS